jgi:CheY-like chemotaxis protein
VLSECESLRSALKILLKERDFDLLLLDMSMPGFDVSDTEPIGGEPEGFAGQELMSQMKLRGIVVPVVVITQYKAFAKGTVGLSDLIDRFKLEFDEIFLGAIYYSTSAFSWRRELAEYVMRIKK